MYTMRSCFIRNSITWNRRNVVRDLKMRSSLSNCGDCGFLFDDNRAPQTVMCPTMPGTNEYAYYVGICTVYNICLTLYRYDKYV